jgi:hypothetical protein
MSLLCPSCLQPYLHLSTLHNPTRIIYVHREIGKVDPDTKEKKPVDWCMSPNRTGAGKHQSEELKLAIAAAQEKNLRNIERSIASQASTVVKFNQTQINYEMSHQNIIEREKTKMPFIGFDLAKLKEEFPASGAGRAGKPSVAISHQGRMQFSAEVSKALAGCTVAQPGRDKDNPLRMRFEGFVETPKGKENTVIDLLRAKPSKVDGKIKNHSVSINGALLMKALKYDFKAAGNQTYEVEKFDIEKHVIVFSLPKELPNKKAKKERKPRKAKVAAAAGAAGASAGTNGAPKSNIEAINKGEVKSLAADDELSIEE